MASRDEYFADSDKVSWYKDRILNFPSVAAYSNNDPSEPVSWVMVYATFEIGSLYTSESHRRKGLGQAVMAAMCCILLDNGSGIPPYCLIKTDKIKSKQLVEKLGFTKTEFEAYFIEKD